MKASIRLRPSYFLTLLTLASMPVVAGCGNGAAESPATPPATAGGLSEAQLRLGIGPVTELTLGPIDAALAKSGEESFKMKCMACHKMDTRYVGPPLGDVMSRRTPEYIMNMMLNPAEMLEKHPEAKQLLAQFLTPMPNQNLTQEEARALLEYLRTVPVPAQENEEAEG
jgi:cytochrome c1